MEVLLLIWIGAALFIGYAAKERGRNAAVWTFASIIFSPLLAGLGLVLLPAKPKTVRDGITFTDIVRGKAYLERDDR